MQIDRPTLVIDKQKCLRNIERMARKASQNNTLFRPHFKTHQSLEIGEWFRPFGVTSITVSSLDMALYFSKNWSDITVAFPVNSLEVDKINLLTQTNRLNILFENFESVQIIKDKLIYPVGFFIEIDTGACRSGIAPNQYDKIDAILNLTKSNANLTFKGFLTHAGHSYACKSHDEIKAVHTSSVDIMDELKVEYLSVYDDIIISVGDTPTCTRAEDFFAVDEMRPGNFIFNDIMQKEISTCTFDDIAVAVACPVVAKHEDRNEVVIFGGGVHLSKDHLIQADGAKSFGKVSLAENGKWTCPLVNTYVKSLSQEHGVISVDPAKMNLFNIGDIIYILPIHSCIAMNLMRTNWKVL